MIVAAGLEVGGSTTTLTATTSPHLTASQNLSYRLGWGKQGDFKTARPEARPPPPNSRRVGYVFLLTHSMHRLINTPTVPYTEKYSFREVSCGV